MTQFWPPGFGTHKMTTSVRHQAQSICQSGHDIGRYIPHVPLVPAPNNALLPLQMFKSSCKNNFSAATVKMNKKATGCSILLNGPPMPMTSCGEPYSIPLTCSPSSKTNNVMVGMSWTSYLITALTVTANVLVDRFLAKGKATPKSYLRGLLTVDDTRGVYLKSGVAAASGIARLALTDEDGSFPMIAGAPFGLEVTRTADGTLGLKGDITLGKDGHKVKASLSGAFDGSWGGGISYKRTVKGGQDESGYHRPPSEGEIGFSLSEDKDGNVTAEVVGKRSDGVEHKYTRTRSAPDASGQRTTKDTVSQNSAVGNAQHTSSKTRDASGNTVDSSSEASVTPLHRPDEKRTYPIEPEPQADPLPPGTTVL